MALNPEAQSTASGAHSHSPQHQASHMQHARVLETSEAPGYLSEGSTFSPARGGARTAEDATKTEGVSPSPQTVTYFSEPEAIAHFEYLRDDCSDLSMARATHMIPTDPKKFRRYEGRYTYPEDWSPGPYTQLKPLTRSFKAAALPDGWRVFVHPEGARYFYLDDPDKPVAVLTEAWLYDCKQLDRTADSMKQVFTYMEQNKICFREPKPEEATTSFPSTVLVLDIGPTSDVRYYFVSHPDQAVFWLDTYDFSYAVSDVHIRHTHTSIGLEMKSQYWVHNALFPHTYELKDQDIGEVHDMVQTAIGDALMSTTGVLVAFSREDLQEIRSMLPCDEPRKSGKSMESIGERWTICRVLAEFYHERFLNLHGERGARLDCKQTIYSMSCSTSSSWLRRFSHIGGKDDGNLLWMRLISLAMLGGPSVHLKRLRSLTIDKLVRRAELGKYKKRLMEEWREVNLYGTVLLGANVSFLTIQTVDDAGKDGPNRTSSQRVSYLSILASIGTIVSSFLLLQQHRDIMTAKFVVHRSVTRLGLESLALMYGMPFSLAVWAIITFFLSFAILWLDNTDRVVIGLVLSCTIAFSFFVFWVVLAHYLGPESSTHTTRENPEAEVETGLKKEGLPSIGHHKSLPVGGTVEHDGALSKTDIISTSQAPRRPKWASTSSTMV